MNPNKMDLKIMELMSEMVRINLWKGGDRIEVTKQSGRRKESAKLSVSGNKRKQR